MDPELDCLVPVRPTTVLPGYEFFISVSAEGWTGGLDDRALIMEKHTISENVTVKPCAVPVEDGKTVISVENRGTAPFHVRAGVPICPYDQLSAKISDYDAQTEAKLSDEGDLVHIQATLDRYAELGTGVTKKSGDLPDTATQQENQVSPLTTGNVRVGNPRIGTSMKDNRMVTDTLGVPTPKRVDIRCEHGQISASKRKRDCVPPRHQSSSCSISTSHANAQLQVSGKRRQVSSSTLRMNTDSPTQDTGRTTKDAPPTRFTTSGRVIPLVEKKFSQGFRRLAGPPSIHPNQEMRWQSTGTEDMTTRGRYQAHTEEPLSGSITPDQCERTKVKEAVITPRLEPVEREPYVGQKRNSGGVLKQVRNTKRARTQSTVAKKNRTPLQVQVSETGKAPKRVQVSGTRKMQGLSHLANNIGQDQDASLTLPQSDASSTLSDSDVARLIKEEPLCQIKWNQLQERLGSEKELRKLQRVVIENARVFDDMEYMTDDQICHNYKVKLDVDESKLRPSYAEKDNPHSRKIKNEHCRKGVDMGYLRISNSPFSSPTILVKKK